MDRLGEDLIALIMEYLSTELFVYFFPRHAKKAWSMRADSYYWASFIDDNRVRFGVFLWLIKNRIQPISSYGFDFLCKKGSLYLLRLMDQAFQVQGSSRAVDWASTYGHVDVLEWLYHNKVSKFDYKFDYTQIALDGASECGYVDVLDWWKRKYKHNCVTLKYTKRAMDRTLSTGVLEWWLRMATKYEIELKYSTKSIDTCTDVSILNWWLNAYLNYGIRMKYKMWAVNYASSRGDINLLNWWFYRIRLHHTHISVKYNEIAVDQASANGHVKVLEWWLDNWETNRFHMKYSSDAIDLASGNGHVHVLEWWFKMYQEGRVLLKRTVEAVNRASQNEKLDTLDWWLNLHMKHKIPLLYDSRAIESALIHSHIFQWWANVCRRTRLGMENFL